MQQPGPWRVTLRTADGETTFTTTVQATSRPEAEGIARSHAVEQFPTRPIEQWSISHAYAMEGTR